MRRPCSEMAKGPTVATILPGVTKIAGMAITPVKPRTTSHTRFVRVMRLTRESNAIAIATANNRCYHLNLPREGNRQYQREQSHYADTRIKRLQQSSLVSGLLRDHGARQSAGEADHRGFQKAALHPKNSVRRRRNSRRFTTSEAASSKPTTNIAESK